ALKVIKEKHPGIEVIMLSSHSKEGSTVTMEALEMGALDFIEKSSDRGDTNFITEELEDKLKVFDLISKNPGREKRT
ncbi:MAG TPA: chemotaxis response regulator protein-glutamate methylesterase, partial [Clostridiaceae bacterium]|nr:chemotaxis response regulator protein-glutamate methylesterase [Clostridiaceae bacterium]